MSPILVRPVREQLEHDRIIRLLQAKWKRRFDVAINPGMEQNAPVGIPPTAVYPDLVLSSLDRRRRLEGVVEVETGESVNHLEALAQWAHLGRLRAPFHLYVPAGMVDVARRLCEDNQIHVSEFWTYHGIGDQVRFTLVHRSREQPAPPPSPRAARTVAPRQAPARRKAAPARGKAPARVKKAAKKPARAQKRR